MIEDDATIRTAVAVTLRDDGYEVRDLVDGNGIAQIAEEFRPDLAVVDIRLPSGPNGYDIARMLRNTGDVAVLFLTASDGLDARLAGFSAGADDYMTKPFSLAELLARVRAILRRAGRLGLPPVWHVGDLVVDEGASRVTRGGEPLELTRMERSLLGVLASHPGQVYSKAQLLSEVWGYDSFDVNVVEVHVSALRKKLEAHGPRIVHTVRGAGYVLNVS